jgi:molybdopterin-guanine dinucleotide biosynthesis protein B
MKIFGIAGRSGMGKTTLLERLIPELTRRGMSVSLIKHSHKHIDIDRPGKDSYRLREAGCAEVLLLGHDRWALMHELRGAREPSLDELLPHMQPCDLLLIEGFKGGEFPKLEVWRASENKPMLWPQWPGILGVATDDADAVPAAPPPQGPPRLAIADAAALADFVLAHAAELPLGYAAELPSGSPVEPPPRHAARTPDPARASPNE